ncbi:MAG: HAD-IA family hydrolase [Burkholderiales bacterium]|nr:HAD-IA family hydrolase [Phycisphaerae bacterium]
MATVKLIVFDLGRVLVRICDDWHHAAEVAGLSGQFPEADPISRAVMGELSVLCEIGAINHAMFCRRVAHLFNVPTAHVEKISEAYLLCPYDGAAALIDDLRRAGVRTAALSNTNSRHWELMTASPSPIAELLQKLDHRITSFQAGLRKPDAQIFAHVERLAGATGAQILFFDDVLDNVAAAQTQGWDAVLVTNRDDPVSQIRTALGESGIL